jgi:RNA polymerase sigma-70 factor (ECF subfamily)
MSEKYCKFYEEYKNKLFSYLMYKSGDYEVSRDILQESFTRHFQRYGHEAVMSPALLYTIARNALVDHFRQQKKFPVSENIIPQAAADQEKSFIAKEEVSRMHESLNKLPEQDREILSLAVNGVVYKEIAEMSGLSVANVKVRIHRARVTLRKLMQNEVK